jgi:hypothetical protein
MAILKHMSESTCFVNDLIAMGLDNKEAQTLREKLAPPRDLVMEKFKTVIIKGLNVIRIKDPSMFSLYKSEDRVLWMNSVHTKLFLGATKLDTKTCIVCNLEDIQEIGVDEAHPLRIEIKQKLAKPIRIQVVTPKTQVMLASCLAKLVKQAHLPVKAASPNKATMSFATPPSGSAGTSWV